jgi:malate dehydrogenase (oxaloacetate-decarboxylating)(NADP+)
MNPYKERFAADTPYRTLDEAVAGANVLIFPDLTSGNICYKLLNRIGGAEAIGPILMGMKKPIHVLQRGDDVANIVNMAAITVADAQNSQRRPVFILGPSISFVFVSTHRI